jgi:hypothetical protein
MLIEHVPEGKDFYLGIMGLEDLVTARTGQNQFWFAQSFVFAAELRLRLGKHIFAPGPIRRGATAAQHEADFGEGLTQKVVSFLHVFRSGCAQLTAREEEIGTGLRTGRVSRQGEFLAIAEGHILQRKIVAEGGM